MKLQPQLLPARNEYLVRAIFLSLLVHGLIFIFIFLFAGQQTHFNSNQLISVNLAEIAQTSDMSKLLPTSQKTNGIRTQEKTMNAPSPDSQILQESQETPPQIQAKPTIENSLSLGITHGFFRSLANGETLRDDIREYYFNLLNKINERWWELPRTNDADAGTREVVVTLVMKKNGEIFDVRMVKSSGNPEYDRLILNTLQGVSPLPPLPESYRGEYFQAPLRLVAPLRLMFS